MTEEQIVIRYLRGWISLDEYCSELVRFYDREDAKERKLENKPDPLPDTARLQTELARAWLAMKKSHAR